MFGFGQSQHNELTPAQLAELLRNGRALVIDVREPNEFATGHIPGAQNMPLSTFSTAQLPHGHGKMIVLNCAAGRRSAMALDKCEAARAEVYTHLAGGFGAWRAAGLPVE